MEKSSVLVHVLLLAISVIQNGSMHVEVQRVIKNNKEKEIYALSEGTLCREGF